MLEETQNQVGENFSFREASDNDEPYYIIELEYSGISKATSRDIQVLLLGSLGEKSAAYFSETIKKNRNKKIYIHVCIHVHIYVVAVHQVLHTLQNYLHAKPGNASKQEPT